MVIRVIDGIRRSVVRKAASEIPAFVRLKNEGVLDDLDNHRQAAELHRSLISDAASRANISSVAKPALEVLQN